MTAVLLGGQPLNFNIVNRMREFGMDVVVVDYREQIQLVADRHIVCDAKDPELGRILRCKGIDSVGMVYTSMDNAGLAQRDVCREFGLKFPSIESVMAAHDKSLMHKKWKDAGLLNRFSLAYGEFDDSIIEENKAYDLIFKPTDSCASRGITVVSRNSSAELLKEAFHHAKEGSDSGLVNVEEFIRGTEFTVEMLGDAYGNVAAYSSSKKYHTKNTCNNKIAVKLHYNAADVSDELYFKITEFGRKCFKALGLTASLGHLEVLLKEDGTLTPVEMGARSSGYIASDLVDVASGRCFLRDFMRVQHGEAIPDISYERTDMSSMYYFYDLPSGSVSVRKSSILPFVRPFAKSLFSDRSALVRGKKFECLQADTDRYGYEILLGKRDEFTIESLSCAEQDFLHDFLGANQINADTSVPIFDTIVHPTMDGNWLNVRWNGLSGIDELSRDFDDYNISGALAVGMEGVGAYDEKGFVKFCSQEPRLKAIAFWNPDRSLQDMSKLRGMGYVGIKIHPRLSKVPIDDCRVIEAMREANRLRMIVLCCSFAGITEGFAEQTRGLKFVLLHTGYRDFARTVKLMLGAQTNALLDLSYTMYHCPTLRNDILTSILASPNKFCIGSDHPEINHRQLREMLTIVCEQLPQTVYHMICHDNIEKFMEV